MNLVVDTSVIIAVIADEPEKPILIAKTEGFELFAPRSLHWEIGNSFSAMLKRQRITLEEAKAAVAIYQQIPLNLVEIDLEQAFGAIKFKKKIIQLKALKGRNWVARRTAPGQHRNQPSALKWRNNRGVLIAPFQGLLGMFRQSQRDAAGCLIARLRRLQRKTFS